PVRPADQQLAMAGHPLQHRVGDDHIRQALRLPVPDIVDHERQPRCLARRDWADGGGRRRPRDGFLDKPAGRLDHLGRVVHAAHRGGGPALGEQGGQVAWAAAHVDHVSGKLCSDPGEQVKERSGALASKPQIKGRVPHGGQSLSNTERHSAGHGGRSPWHPLLSGLISLYRKASLDVKRYALVMGQRAGPGIEPTAPADSDAEILGEPMQVLSRISRLARHLDIARRGAFAEHELESWEFDVLSALRRQGPPFQLTPGALLRATLVTSGTMTNRIDRLERKGLVRREPDPRDKRGVLVTLTGQGQERVDAALAGLLRRERALLAGLDDAERWHLADLMRILLAPFDAAE